MKRWLFLGAAFTVFAIAAQFPASWLAPVVARATHERWRLAATEGTVWRGGAMLYTYDRTSGYWSAARGVTWHVLWDRLASGVIATQLEFDDNGRAKLAAGLDGWSLADVDASFPAALLAVLLPSTIGDYGWAGTVVARGTAFRCGWRRPLCTGQFDFAWSSAATAQIPGPVLGDYSVRVIGEGDALRFAVSTLQGRLQLAGAGEISAGRLRFTGEARAHANDDVRLESLLRVVGRPGTSPGRYLIEYIDGTKAR